MGFCSWIQGRLLHVRCETQKVTVDVACLYQWAVDERQRAVNEGRRQQVWQQLGRLLQGLPKRNLLVLGADANASCRHSPGCVGRGVLDTTSRNISEDFMQILQVNQLVLLNTWSLSRGSASHTFHNGSHRSQIDFLATRRPVADQESRRASAIALDLTPWRFGPKHRPVVGSLPWRAGWTFHTSQPHTTTRRIASSIREAIRGGSESTTGSLRRCLAELTTAATGTMSLTELNKRALQASHTLLCPQAGKPPKRPQPASGNVLHVVVKPHIQAMWAAHRRLKSPLHGSWFRRIFDAFLRFRDFSRRSRELRANCRRACRARLMNLIDQAQVAAETHDMGTVYRIIRHIAPKTRRLPTCIRSAEGQLLSSSDQFRAIHDYFATAYDSTCPVPDLPSGLGLRISVEEIKEAITSLKPGKAVPDGSLPAELWKLSPDSFAGFLHEELCASIENSHSYPPEISECTLSLLPKPGKSSKLPKDLRPLGLQDPSAKIFATVLKHRIMDQAGPALQKCPQYAYSKGKAIDEAILRVSEHCRNIRDSLKQSTISVHAKRAGRRASSCHGGIMLSLDLSKAFDCVPRWALLAALDHVGVDAELQAAVLSIHERCRYHIQHGRYKGSFAMRRGIRQGCALSPCLYSIFTVWLFEQLAARTDPNWAASCATLFADDTHLHWTVHSLSDLEFCCHCIRETFAVFRAAGMQVNSSKSALVVSLKGNAAKMWLRRKQQRTPQGRWISVGMPHQPLLIPREDKMLYLGIIASYQNFELQTYRHRLQVARGNRQRLIQTLHAAGLSLKYRVRLYAACVRSSLTYGLHAIGYTAEVCQRLEQADARFLRAVARSPSHLTHESSVALRKRLCIASPSDAAVKLLQGRVTRCADQRSTAFFQKQLDFLSAWNGSADVGSSGLIPVFAESAVACTICGQYFPSRRIMLSHLARMHPECRRVTCRTRAREYTHHTVDGMPQCRHCLKVFTRVEGLKKHLKQACPVLHRDPPVVSSQPGNDKAPSEGVAQVPTPRELSHTGRAAPGGAKEDADVHVTVPMMAPASEIVTSPPVASTTAAACVESATSILLDAPDFRSAVLRDWRGLVRGGKYNEALRTYCAFCGQYVHMIGPGLKQHLRLAHPHEYARHQEEAESRCHGLGLPAESPSRFCKALHKAPRVHLKRCPVLFQASFANLLLRDSVQAAQHGCPDGRTGSPGPGGICGSVWKRIEGEGEGQGQGEERPVAGPGAQAEVLPRGGESRQRRLVECGIKLGPQGVVGSTSWTPEMGRPRPERGYPGRPDATPDTGDGAPVLEARARTWHDPSRDGIYAVPGYPDASSNVVPAETSGDRGRLDGEECCWAGQDGAEGDANDGIGQRASDETGSLSRGAGENHSGRGDRLDRPGSHGDGSGLALFRLESQDETTGTLRSTTGGHQCSPGLPGHTLQESGGSGCPAAVPEHQRPGGQLRLGGSGSISPLDRTTEQSSPPVLSSLYATCGQRSHETAWPSDTPGTACQTASSKEGGGMLQGSELLRLEQSQLNELQSGRGCLGRQHGAAGSEGAQLPSLRAPRLPTAKLINQANYCYLHSCLQAVYWMGEILGCPPGCYGKLQAGFALLRSNRKIVVPECLSLRPVLQSWREPLQQHDAGEYMRHLLCTLQSQSYSGHWEARLTNPHTVTDQVSSAHLFYCIPKAGPLLTC